MAPDERIRIILEGDPDDLQRALRAASKDLGKFSADVDRADTSSRRASKGTDQLHQSAVRLKGGISGVNQQFMLLRNVMGLIRWPAMAAGAGVATQAVVALGSGVIGLTSNLLQLAPAAAAGAQGITALIQAMGVGKLAAHGIGDALKAHAQDAAAAGAASVASGAAQEAAARRVQDATRNLGDTQEQAILTQKTLSIARREARDELDKLRFASENAALAERGAELGLRSALAARRAANREFAKGTGSMLSVDQADLGVDEARLRVKEARKAKADQARDEARLRRDGIEGSRQVIAANKAIKAATDSVADASRNLADAQKDQTKALTTGAGAASKFDEQMKKLPESSQDFIRQLLTMKPLLEQLRKTAADGVLPGAGRGLKDATKSFDELNHVTDVTAQVLGEIAENAGKFVGGEGRDLQLIGESNARVIGEMGSAGIHLAGALSDILVAARPLTEHLARMFDRWARNTEQTIAAKRASGDLAETFERAQDALDQWGRIIGNVAHAIGNVVGASQPLGQTLTDDIEKVTEKWERWTDSIEGQEKMATYFTDALPAIRELAGLAGDIVVAILKIGGGDSVVPIVKTLREELIPALEGLLTASSGDFAVKLVDALSQIVELVAILVAPTGALSLIVDMFGGAAGAMGDLLESSELLVSTISGMLIFATFYKLLAGAVGLAGSLGTKLGSAADKLKNLGGGAPGGGKSGKSGVLGDVGDRGGIPGKPLYVFVVNGGTGVPLGGAPPVLPGGAGSTAAKTGIRGAASMAGSGALAMVGGPAGVAIIATAAALALGASNKGKRTESAEKGAVSFEAKLKGLSPADTANLKAYFAMWRSGTNEATPKIKAMAIEGNKLMRELAPNAHSSKDIDELAEAFDRLPGPVRVAAAAIELAGKRFHTLDLSATNNLTNIRGVVAVNMKEIADTLGSESQAGRVAASAEFKLAADAIREAMRDGKISTKTGLAEIRRMMAAELAAYGIDPKKAKDIAKLGGTSDDSFRIAGGSGGGTQAAGKAYGMEHLDGPVGGDSIPLMVAPGEDLVVFNRHQRQVADQALGAAGYDGLPGLFQDVNKPHIAAMGFAKGGIVAAGRRLRKLGYNVSENRALGDNPLPGAHSSTGWHYRENNSGAIDVNADSWPEGEKSALDKAATLLRGWGLRVLWQVAGHFNHLHGDNAEGGGSVPGAAAAKMKAVKWTGPGGTLGAIGKAGLRNVQAGAQSVLDRAVAAAGGESEVSPGGKGSGDVIKDFRRAIKATKAPPRAQLALWEAGIVESGLQNLAGGDSTSTGALQLLSSTAAGTGINARDPYAVAVGFLTRGYWGKGGAISLAANNPQATSGWIAQQVQGSAYPGRYDQVAGRARSYLGRGGILRGAKGAARGRSPQSPKIPSGAPGLMSATKPPRAKKGPGKGLPAGTSGHPSLGSVWRLGALETMGSSITQAGTTYGQTDRRFGQSDENPTQTVSLPLPPEGLAALLATRDDPAEAAWLATANKSVDGASEKLDVEVRDVGGISTHLGELSSLRALKLELIRMVQEEDRVAREATEELGRGIVVRELLVAELEKQIAENIRESQQNIARIKTLTARIKDYQGKLQDARDDLRAERGKKRKDPKRIRALTDRVDMLGDAIKRDGAEVRALTGRNEEISGTNDDLGGRVSTTNSELGDWRGALSGTTSLNTSLPNDLTDLGLDVGDIDKEIVTWTGTRPTPPDLSQLTPKDDAYKSGLLTQRNEQLRTALAVQTGQFQVLSGFMSVAAPRIVGRFAHGTDRVRETGLALVHRDETITADAQGPYGANRASPTMSPIFNITVEGDIGPMIKRVRVEAEGAADRKFAQTARRGRALASARRG